MTFNKTSAALLYVGILGLFLYHITYVELLRLAAVGAGLILLVLELRSGIKRYWPLFLLSTFLVLGLWLEAVRTNWRFGISSSVLVVAETGMTLALLKRRGDPRVIDAFLLLCAGYLAYFMLTGASPDTVLVDRSRNHISVLILNAACLSYAVNVFGGRKISMVPALIALVLSVWAVGRGGILSSAFLAIGIFFVVKKTRLDYLVIVLGCILLFVGLYGEEFLPVLLFEKSFSLSKFDFGVVELARADIIGRYISMLDIDRVLVGFDWYESYYLFPSGNLHNSYLELHYRIGIFAFMVVLMAFIALAKGLLHKRIYFVLLATIMIRAVSDTVMLPAHMFDFVFYFLVTVSILLGENSVHKAAQTRLLNSASISHRLNRARLFEG